ncbi:MAG: PKD domain-containing protein, partial [Bacteroidia bacterium]
MRKIIQNTVITLVLLFSINALKAQCSANFSYTIGANGTVNFVSTSIGTATSTQYYWNFGDGGTYTSFGNGTAAHTYSTNQVFSVYLSIVDSISFNPTCYSTYSDTLLINNAQCSGNLAFTYYVGLNGSVYFNDNSTGVSSNSTYTFSFGDGTTSSGAYSSVHTYTAAGIYTVSITAADQFSICSYATTQTVNVTINICPLVPSYSYTIGSNGNVNFVSTTTGTTASTIYYWNFGDGNSATGSSASNNYFNSGNYTATLFVSDSV